MLQGLNIFIEDILDIGSRTRETKEPSKKSNQAATAALSKFIVQKPADSLSLPALINNAADQKATLQEYLTLLSTEPVVLSHAVKICFFSRSELLPDERGRTLPVHTDKYISGAVLEVFYNAVQAVAIWEYIFRLLDLLVSQPASNKIYRAIILQEISNVCHLEYARIQAVFKRNVQIMAGSKWFKRISGVYNKAGDARVAMKGDPEVLLRSDPQLHYMLRLYQANDASRATEWMKKLSDLYEAHPSEQEKLYEREADSLSNLAIVTSFVQNLSSTISLPTLSRKKNQMFVTRSQELDEEINELKSKVDLTDLVVPIDNLREPGVANKALNLLDQVVIDNAGTKMGFLYQDLVEECFVEIKRQYKESIQTRAVQNRPAEVTSFPPPVPEPREKRMEQRKQKEKTRPSHSSVYEIVAPPKEEGPLEAEPPTIFKVKASTAAVFSTLFTKGASRGSVSWTAFVSAMTDLGLSVQPKTGSVYTFEPPESISVNKSLTLHRPHRSEIERHHIIVYAIRLRKKYGWNEKTFEVDE